MNGLAAVYGNHLGAQLLGLATAAAERTPRSGSPRPTSPSAPNAPSKNKRWLPEQPQEEEEEYEDEIIEEMSGNWTPGTNTNSTTTTSQVVPRVDSVEWTKMEEGPDDETQLTEPAEDDDLQVLRTLKRKRKSLEDKDLKDEKGSLAGGAEQLPPGKKRLSCIDCGCRAALKACSKVMCIDCCPKEGRVCGAHAKKLYEKEVRKLDQPTGAEKEPHNKDKEGSSKQSAKKRSRVRASPGDGGEQEDDLGAFSFGGEGGGGEEESDGALVDNNRGTDRNGDGAGEEGEERGAAKAKRSILYETIAKQDKKIRALQNDLKELRTLLLSVVDKQTAFSRQLRHISGHSDGLVIDEDEEGDEDGS